jgi:hypothetical protein
VGVLVAAAIGIAIGLLLVWANARAAITIAVLEIEDGKLTVTRGGLSPRVVSDLRDIAARPRIRGATLRVVRAKDHARVEMHGDLDANQMQRFRNVIGNVPLAQLVKAKRR